MPRPFARRLADIEPFHVMAVLDRARRLEGAGRDIVHLEIGEPDFSTAEPIVAAGRQALADGLTHYTQAAGLPALREAIAGWYAHYYGLDVDPARILVTPGASGALLLASALLLNPGDGLLMSDPGYPCNRHFLRLLEAEAQLVPVDAASGYRISAETVAPHWRDNTAGVLAASPSNPTGTLLDAEVIAELARLCRQRGGWLLVDEIYHGLTYGGRAPSALAAGEDVFVINSFSKYFGMTGWRLGWLVAPQSAVSELEKLAQNLFIAAPTVAQHAALAAFQPQTLDILEQRRAEFGRRRDFLLPELRRLGFTIPESAPEGAFYLYAGIENLAADSEQLCLELLEQHGIALTPGRDFGRHGAAQHVRFAYTTGMDRLEEAVRRLEAVR